jgi:hypothetical protein
MNVSTRSLLETASVIITGILHLIFVEALNACLGLAFTQIYLRWRNLWPLGIYHAWLGVFAYFWVLHRDPWLEVFGSF